MVNASPESAGLLSTAWGAAKRALRFSVSGSSGYDAVKGKNKRSAPTGLNRSEDGELRPNDRRKLVSAARDIHRNFSLASWMIRRHLDYVTTFNFQPKCADPAHNESLSKLMRWWNSPANCDVTGRFSFAQMIRLAEMRRTIDGDLFALKLKDGRLQMIEGDRVRTPNGGVPGDAGDTSDFLLGVKTDDAGKALQYCVCKRRKLTDKSAGSADFQFERLVKAQNMYQFAYFDRFDQVRGISPLACSINSLRDVYEGFDYALAKMKVAQLFGLAIFREKSDDIGVPGAAAETDEEDSDEEDTQYKINFGDGPVFLDLDPGDRAEFLENKTPSIEFQQFSQVMIGVALKCLDIPYSFYDESFTNYSGQRQARLLYEAAAKLRQQQVRDFLDHLTAWRINLWIQDGILDADIGDLSWDWIHEGIGWIDPLKEIQATLTAIEGGLQTRTQACREATGRDFKDVVKELADETKYANDLGVFFAKFQPIPIIEIPQEVQNAAAA